MKLRQRNILQYNNFVACPLWASVILVIITGDISTLHGLSQT